MGKNGNPENTATTENKDYDVSNFLKAIEEAMPEGADPISYYKDKVVEAEKRRRHTVASYTKGQQHIKTLEAQNDFLKQKIEASINLTQEQRDELEELKFKDPDAWRAKLDNLEAAHKREFDAQVSAELDRIKNLSVEEFEKEKLADQLRRFIEANPELDITKDEIADQIPPIYMKRLANQEITFEEFLANVKKFLTAPEKKLSRETPPASSKNTSGVRGTSEAPVSKEVSNILDNSKNLKF